MGWLQQLRHLFDSATRRYDLWDSAAHFSDLAKDQVLRQTTILEGYSNCHLVLDQGVHLQVDGELHGNIIGKGENTVRLNGQVHGVICCTTFVLNRSGKLTGKLCADKLIIATGATLHGGVQLGQFLPAGVDPEKAKDETYLLSDQFQQWLSGSPPATEK